VGEEAEETEITPFDKMLDTLVTTMMCVAFVIILRIAVVLNWKYRANVKFYKEQACKSSRTAPEHPTNLAKKRKKEKPVTFSPLPDALVFPSIEFLVFGIFTIGLTEAAVAALVDSRYPEQSTCQLGCIWVAVMILVIEGLLTVLAFTLLIRFHRFHLKSVWCVRPLQLLWCISALNELRLCSVGVRCLAGHFMRRPTWLQRLRIR